MNPGRFHHMAVIGVGLLGGSLALAARKRGLVERVIGVGRTRKNLDLALSRNLVDEVATDPAVAVSAADLVVLAGPLGTFRDTVKRIRSRLRKGTVVTDVGSVKGNLVSEIESLVPAGVAYVAGHPITGGSVSGAGHARADLFVGTRCVLTPTASTPVEALVRVEQFWHELGADVVRMAPDIHDRVFAYVSHLPHLVSYALMDCVGEQNGHVQNAGKGLMDTTRIAGSPPEIWSDIFRMNRDYLLESLSNFQEALDAMRRALEDDNEQMLKALLRKAKEVRDRLEQG